MVMFYIVQSVKTKTNQQHIPKKPNQSKTNQPTPQKAAHTCTQTKTKQPKLKLSHCFY